MNCFCMKKWCALKVTQLQSSVPVSAYWLLLVNTVYTHDVTDFEGLQKKKGIACFFFMLDSYIGEFS